MLLDEEQRRRVRDALQKVKTGEATHAVDLIGEWKPRPDTDEMDDISVDVSLFEADYTDEWVSVDRIVGTKQSQISRFVTSRLESVFEWLLSDEFENGRDDSRTPRYVELGGDLYVGGDGTHRSIACKVAGVDELYAKVKHVPVDEQRYGEWVEARDVKIRNRPPEDDIKNPYWSPANLPRTDDAIHEISYSDARIRVADAKYLNDVCPQCGDDFVDVSMNRNADLVFIHEEGADQCLVETDADRVYFRNSGITLTNSQRERAEDALERVRSEDATHPSDLVDTWRGAPTPYHLSKLSANLESDSEFPETRTTYGWISPSNIVGTDHELTGRFVKGRMESAFERLIDGRYQPDYIRNNAMPHYDEIDGDLYVGVDGNHRSIACKTVGIGSMYARITEHAVDVEEYRLWKARKDGALIETWISNKPLHSLTAGSVPRVDRLVEVVVAFGLRDAPTTDPDELVYVSEPMQCDICSDTSQYTLRHVTSSPRQLFGVNLPWHTFAVETMCYECWVDSPLSDEYYTPDDPDLLFDIDTSSEAD